MATKDLHNNLKYLIAIVPVVVSDNTAQAGAIIDTAGYEGVEFTVLTGVLADVDATFTVGLTEGNDPALADGAAVAAADCLGLLTTTGFTFASDSTTLKVGYRGTKRYLKLTITPVNNAGSAPLAAVATLGHARHAPVA